VKALFTMAREYAHSISIDTGNRSMRKAGRKAWNEDDSNAATEAFNRCWPLEAEYPWATPEQIAQMKRELGYDK
jgi:hypothetical protein